MSFPNDKERKCLSFQRNNFWREALFMLLVKIFRSSSCRILQNYNKRINQLLDGTMEPFCEIRW